MDVKEKEYEDGDRVQWRTLVKTMMKFRFLSHLCQTANDDRSAHTNKPTPLTKCVQQTQLAVTPFLAASKSVSPSSVYVLLFLSFLKTTELLAGKRKLSLPTVYL
jgi:hypothetical protein